jgi:hypothetical protein
MEFLRRRPPLPARKLQVDPASPLPTFSAAHTASPAPLLLRRRPYRPTASPAPLLLRRRPCRFAGAPTASPSHAAHHCLVKTSSPHIASPPSPRRASQWRPASVRHTSRRPRQSIDKSKAPRCGGSTPLIEVEDVQQRQYIQGTEFSALLC